MKRGFTLIEILVVITVLALLTSLLILYSRTSEQQLVLFREQAKLVSNLLRSKSLAIQTLWAGEAVCGYGVHFDPAANQYVIFKDVKVGESCDLIVSDKKLTSPTEAVETVDLTAAGVVLSPETGLTDIFFQPPDPKVFLTPTPIGVEAQIVLKTPDGSSSAVIIINKAGQVSAL